jgi:hypothetical protein
MITHMSAEETFTKFFTVAEEGKIVSYVRVDLGVSHSPVPTNENDIWKFLAKNKHLTKKTIDSTKTGDTFGFRTIGDLGETIQVQPHVRINH